MTARGSTACVAWLLCALACNRIDYAPGPLPTAPPLPPLAEPVTALSSGRTVLFAIHQQRAVPLYCQDHGQRRFGADCVPLLPSSLLEVHLSNFSVATLRAAGRSGCTLGGKTLPAFAIVGQLARDGGIVEVTAALWSDSTYPLLLAPPVPTEHLPETPSQLRGMRAACASLGSDASGKPLSTEPLSTWHVDLDGDGVRERVDDVKCFDGKSELVTARIVLLTPGRRPERTVPLRVSSPKAVLRFDAVTDADANGVPEVMLSTLGESSQRIELGRLKDGGLETLNEALCESPVAPAKTRAAAR